MWFIYTLNNQNDFEGNKKMFLKEVKRVRKGKPARDEIVKDVNGKILRVVVEVRRRWPEYFERKKRMCINSRG